MTCSTVGSRDDEKNAKPDFSSIFKNNPTGFILRERISEATGGLIHHRTIANLDALGKGIPRFRVGRKICYLVEDVVAYIEDRVEMV